jgi:formylmethanofuran dehydrogenase subunit E
MGDIELDYPGFFSSRDLSQKAGASDGTNAERVCEDCGEPTPTRRFRCRDCGKLVCAWCSGHVHRTRND